MSEFNIKRYLENHMGFKTLGCVRNKHSVVYKMKHEEGFEMLYEMMGNGSMEFTIEGETRTLPPKEVLEKSLGHEPSEVQILRLVFQIVSKMLDNHRDETAVELRNKFERHANKQK